MGCPVKKVRMFVSTTRAGIRAYSKQCLLMMLAAVAFIPICKYCSVILIGVMLWWAHKKATEPQAASPEAVAAAIKEALQEHEGHVHGPGCSHHHH